MAHEFDFIDWVRTQQSTAQNILVAAGDDLAILRTPPADLLLIGIDQVLDGVHFDSAVHAPELIGRKAMNRNLSDCAAMAALPLAAVVTLALPRGCSMEFIKSLYSGMRLAGEPFDCHIVGGDTGVWDQKLAISIAITGRSAGIEPVRRSGAKIGDSIYVTGPLGGSILERHLRFTPRVREARELAQRQPITAMIDLSDGLSRDLAHLCKESGVGAQIDSAAIPIHDDARKLPGDPMLHALNDGEDYELCFTSGERNDAIRIGTIIDRPAILLGDRSMTPAAFEHRF